MQLDDYIGAYREDFSYDFDNRITLNWYPRRILEQCHPQMRVLELGIGHGHTCRRFSEYFDDYTVIDASDAVIRNYLESIPNTHINIVKCYFEDYEADKKYDIIIMGFVLEHVEDSSVILRKYRRFLAPNGRLFVAVPNAQSLHRRIGHEAGILNDVYALSAGDLELGHRRYYSVQSLSCEVEATGYQIIRREGIFLKPLTTSQLISLNLDSVILEGMCRVGVDYPELSAAFLIEAVPKDGSS